MSDHNLGEVQVTTRRRALIAASAAAALPVAMRMAFANDTTQADFLFVQTAKAMSFDQAANKLTLQGVSPITVMFTDRPERIASHMRTAQFVPFWSKGKDSFLSDPPNADISILEGNELKQIVVTLTDPALDGDSLRRQDHRRRDAHKGIGCVGLHRRNRHAANPPLLRRSGAAELAKGGPLLMDLQGWREKKMAPPERCH
jgi:hypothetical protein